MQLLPITNEVIVTLNTKLQFAGTIGFRFINKRRTIRQSVDLAKKYKFANNIYSLTTTFNQISTIIKQLSKHSANPIIVLVAEYIFLHAYVCNMSDIFLLECNLI